MKYFAVLLIVLSSLTAQFQDSLSPGMTTEDEMTPMMSQSDLDSESDLESQEEEQDLYDSINTPDNFVQETQQEIIESSPQTATVIDNISFEESASQAEEESHEENIVLNPTSVETKSAPTDDQIFKSEYIQKVQKTLNENSPDTAAMQHVLVGFNQLTDIINQIKDLVFNETHSDEKHLHSDTYNLLQSFVINLEYKENADFQNSPPPFWNIFDKKNVTIDELMDYDKNESEFANNDHAQHLVNKFGFSSQEESSVNNRRHLKSHVNNKKGFRKTQEKVKRVGVQSNLRMNKFKSYVQLSNRLTARENKNYGNMYPRAADMFRHQQSRVQRLNGSQKINRIRRKLPLNEENANLGIQSLNASGSGATRFVPKMDINMLPYSLLSVDHLKNFYEEDFKFITDPLNLTVEDLKNKNPVLYDHYHKLHMMEQSYYIGIDSHQTDLLVLAEQFKTLNDKNKFFEFYGLNETSFANKVDYLEAQKIEFHSRVITILNSVHQSLADIKSMSALFGWLALPSKTEDIFTEDFLRTVNYQNLRLPKLIQAKTTVLNNIVELKTELELLNTQKLAMSAALGLKASSSLTRSLCGLVFASLGLMFIQ